MEGAFSSIALAGTAAACQSAYQSCQPVTLPILKLLKKHLHNQAMTSHNKRPHINTTQRLCSHAARQGHATMAVKHPTASHTPTSTDEVSYMRRGRAVLVIDCTLVLDLLQARQPVHQQLWQMRVVLVRLRIFRSLRRPDNIIAGGGRGGGCGGHGCGLRRQLVDDCCLGGSKGNLLLGGVWAQACDRLRFGIRS